MKSKRINEILEEVTKTIDDNAKAIKEAGDEIDNAYMALTEKEEALNNALSSSSLEEYEEARRQLMAEREAYNVKKEYYSVRKAQLEEHGGVYDNAVYIEAVNEELSKIEQAMFKEIAKNFKNIVDMSKEYGEIYRTANKIFHYVRAGKNPKNSYHLDGLAHHLRRVIALEKYFKQF